MTAASTRTVTRMFLCGRAVTSLGDGMWFTIWALYLINQRGFSPATMGTALGIGGILGLFAATPAGRYADKVGPSLPLVALGLVQALAALGYLVVDSAWSLALITAVFTGADSASTGLRIALVSAAIEPDERAKLLARGRSTQHATYALGAGIGAVIVATRSAGLYEAAVVANAVTFVVAALFAIRGWVPKPAADPEAVKAAAGRALNDVPFMAVMATTAVLGLCMAMLSTGLPLWVQRGTQAPLWLAPAAVVLSCVVIAAAQVRVTSRVRNVPGAVQIARYSGLALAVSCLVFAAAGRLHSPVLAASIIVGAVLLQVIGELCYVASRWELSLRLMDPLARGQYQGIAATAEAAVLAVGPALIAVLIGTFGAGGWLLLAPAFLLATVPVAWLSRRAVNRRPTPASYVGA